MTRLIGALLALTVPAGAAPTRLTIDAAAVVAIPGSTLDDFDAGVGGRLTAGFDGRYVGVWGGYRRLRATRPSSITSLKAGVTTAEWMVGARLQHRIVGRVHGFVDLYAAAVMLELDNEEQESGGGGGARVGARIDLGAGIQASVALGGSGAETTSDDSTGVVWSSLELGASYTW